MGHAQRDGEGGHAIRVMEVPHQYFRFRLTHVVGLAQRVGAGGHAIRVMGGHISHVMKITGTGTLDRGLVMLADVIITSVKIIPLLVQSCNVMKSSS